MNNKIIDFNKIKILNASTEILKNLEFDCGDAELNEFLLKDYAKNLESKTCIIYLCKYYEKIVGFFTLSADSIKINEKIEPYYSYYPAIKIGRLGIQKEFHSKKIGTCIIRWITGFCRTLQNKIGIRFISVDAYNHEKQVKFYEKNSFKRFKSKRSKTIPMYLDLEEK